MFFLLLNIHEEIQENIQNEITEIFKNLSIAELSKSIFQLQLNVGHALRIY